MTTIESRVLKMISIRVEIPEDPQILCAVSSLLKQGLLRTSDALGLVLTDEGKEAIADLAEGRA